MQERYRRDAQVRLGEPTAFSLETSAERAVYLGRRLVEGENVLCIVDDRAL